MADTILSVERLTKNFGGLRAVHLDLEVGEGELRCLIGPNGAGKSTFFRMLAGELAPDAGMVRFRGRDITGRAPFAVARLGISIKFQVPSVFEQLPVLQNLHIAAERRLGYAAGRERARHMLDRVRLGERAADPAAWLSHGEKQWLEIAMASIAEPALILLDEPTAGMSPDEVSHTVELVRDLNREATLIVVGHDMDFVRRIAQRVTVMHQGQVFAEGTMAEIEAHPGVRDIYLGRRPAGAERL